VAPVALQTTKERTTGGFQASPQMSEAQRNPNLEDIKSWWLRECSRKLKAVGSQTVQSGEPISHERSVFNTH
jgi:hypothetical protein